MYNLDYIIWVCEYIYCALKFVNSVLQDFCSLSSAKSTHVQHLPSNTL